MARGRTGAVVWWWQVLALASAACALLAGCGGVEREPTVAARGAGTVSIDAAPTRVRGGAGAGVIVDVAGAVRRPGVYRLVQGARVHEAIAAAGGVTAAADTSTLNRAADVVDGEQVLVPSRGAATTSTAGSGGKVSINGADAAALDALPGVGPVLAQRIVDERAANGPFTSAGDLDRVPGIGPAMLARLEPLVTA